MELILISLGVLLIFGIALYLILMIFGALGLLTLQVKEFFKIFFSRP